MFGRVVVTLGILFIGTASSFAEEIDGYGRTVGDAKLDARHQVLKRLQEQMANREPPLEAWKPTLADVDRFLEGPGAAGRSVDIKLIGIQVNWKLPVRFPSDDELVLRDRQARRHFIASTAVLAAIAGLGVWWGVSGWRQRRSERG